MRRDSPFVNVYAASEHTVVHIRQLIYTNECATPSESQDGVVMSLMQFRSLMFHLRALDAQFTQGVAMDNVKSSVEPAEQKLTNDGDNDNEVVGKKR